MAIKMTEEAIARLYKSLDPSVAEMMEVFDWSIFCPDGQDELDHYEHLRRGGCMLCGEPLGEDTIVTVDAQGILGLFCSADCIQDIHIIPYLNDQIEQKLERLMPEDPDAEDQ